MTPTTAAGRSLHHLLMDSYGDDEAAAMVLSVEAEARAESAADIVMARAGDLCLCGHQRSEHHTGDARFRTAPKADR